MAYRLASSWLTRTVHLKGWGVNQWVGKFGGLEEWLLSPRKMLSEPPEGYFSARRLDILVGMKAILSLRWHLLSMSRSSETALRALWGTDEFLDRTPVIGRLRNARTEVGAGAWRTALRGSHFTVHG